MFAVGVRVKKELKQKRNVLPWEGGGGVVGRGTPYNGLYREAPTKRGTFFRMTKSIEKGRENCHSVI